MAGATRIDATEIDDFAVAAITLNAGLNGVSLTVIQPGGEKTGKAHFSVTIIPYTFENTNFNSLKKDDTINLEFDVIGKYVAKYLALYK